MQKVELTYFKSTGKYYEEGAFETEDMDLNEIWDRVIEIRDAGELPGLCKGSGQDFVILVNAPGHQHEHPKLIMPGQIVRPYKRLVLGEA